MLSRPPFAATRPRDRRRFLTALGGLGLAAAQTIRIGFTPAFVHDQHALLADWRRYMEKTPGPEGADRAA